MKKGVKGLTTVELLVVVALLAMFAILSYAAWDHQLKRSRDAQRKADMNEWMRGLYGYYDDTLCFPEEDVMQCGSEALRPYLDRVPCDPLNNSVHYYVYEKLGCNLIYIYARLEATNDPVIEKVGCSDGCGPGGDMSFNYYVTNGDAEVVIDTGADPTCGTLTKYCFPMQCSACCPGAGYRCNATGDRCIVDPSCIE